MADEKGIKINYFLRFWDREWGKWPEESVSYSQSTAEKLMRVFEAFRTQQPASLDTPLAVPESKTENPEEEW